MDIADAEALARRLLASLPRRLAHVSSVARLSEGVASDLGVERVPLVASAWLHDIGYSPEVVATGFHPLDGARFLRDERASAALVGLVAHHSFALVEADLRGLRSVLESEYPYDTSLPHDVLCYCDMTTGPDGQRVTAQERLSEIRARYGPTDIVTKFVGLAEQRIVETVERVEARLAAAQSR